MSAIATLAQMVQSTPVVGLWAATIRLPFHGMVYSTIANELVVSDAKVCDEKITK